MRKARGKQNIKRGYEEKESRQDFQVDDETNLKPTRKGKERQTACVVK